MQRYIMSSIDCRQNYSNRHELSLYSRIIFLCVKLALSINHKHRLIEHLQYYIDVNFVFPDSSLHTHQRCKCIVLFRFSIQILCRVRGYDL